jgi:hypothetical protein
MKQKFPINFLLNCSVFFPVFFAIFVFITGNVNYPQATIESYKYIEIAKYWIDKNSTSLGYESIVQRLPLYPGFIYIIFKIFGFNNLVALIFAQAILGSLTIFMTIKILEFLKLSKNLIAISLIIFNFHIFYRFSVFLPNAFFLFFLTTFIFFFSKFFFEKKIRYFLLLSAVVSLLILTRPIFQLSILTVIPFIIFIIFRKTNIKYTVKISLSVLLISSYFLGLFIQTFRNYNEYGKLSYTIQTGNHLLNVVTALSITEKSACGDMDPEMMVNMEREVANKRSKLNAGIRNDPVVLNKINIYVAKDFLFNEIEIGEIIPSLFCGYFKTFFHPSPSAIYQAFGLSLDGFSITKGNNFFEKSKNFFINSFKNLYNLFWLLCFFFLCLMRFFQLYGVINGLFFSKNKLFYWFLFLTFLTVIAPIIGMSSLRFRTEVETILIIFGVLGIKSLLEKFKFLTFKKIKLNQ